MATQKIRPDEGFVDPELDRQIGRTRNRKAGALALAAVIGVVAVVVVIQAVNEGVETRPEGQTTGGGAILTTEEIPPLPDDRLEPGRYVFTSLDPRLDDPYRISMEVLDGYEGFGGWAALKANADQTAVATEGIGGVYTDPCGTGSLLTGSALSSTDDVVAALASQNGLKVSTPTAVTVDGLAGTYLERTVPAQTDLADCEKQRFVVYTVPLGGERWLEPGQLSLLWILDVDGVPLVIEASAEAGTSAKVREELLQMVESVQIDPR